MKHLISNYKRDMFILAAAYLVIGIILVAFPETSGATIAYICAGLAAFYGITHVIAYVMSKPSFDVYRFDLVEGIAGLGLGVYVAFNPTFIMEVIPTIVAIVILLDSLIKVQNAVDLMRLGHQNWWVVLMMALISSFLGILMLFYPFYTYMSLYTFVGVGMVITAIIDVISIFMVSYQIKKVFKESQIQEMKPEDQIKERMKDVKPDDVPVVEAVSLEPEITNMKDIMVDEPKTQTESTENITQ